MMKAALAVLCLAALPARVLASEPDDIDVGSFEYLDVVETTDGSVWKGVVIEQTPNVQYKIAIAGGSVHVIKAAEVVKMSKQRNTEWRAHVAPAATTPTGVSTTYDRGSGLPPPFAKSGLRLDPELTLVFPTGDIDGYNTSFAPTVRFGYESLFGNFGLGGGGLTRFTYWQLPGNDGFASNDSAWTLETMLYGRAALHLGRVAAHAGLALGVDTNVSDGYEANMSTRVGFGVNLQSGVEIAATRALALKFGFDYHPPTDQISSDVSIEYFALLLGASLHL